MFVLPSRLRLLFSKRVLLFRFEPLTQDVKEFDNTNLSSYRGSGYWKSIDPDANSRHPLTRNKFEVVLSDNPGGGRSFFTHPTVEGRVSIYCSNLMSDKLFSWEHNVGRHSRSHLIIGFSNLSFGEYQLFAFQGAREESQIPALCLAMVPLLRKLEEVKLTSGNANLFIRRVYGDSPLEWRIAYDGEETVDPPWDHLPFSGERKKEGRKSIVC